MHRPHYGVVGWGCRLRYGMLMALTPNIRGSTALLPICGPSTPTPLQPRVLDWVVLSALGPGLRPSL